MCRCNCRLNWFDRNAKVRFVKSQAFQHHASKPHSGSMMMLVGPMLHWALRDSRICATTNQPPSSDTLTWMLLPQEGQFLLFLKIHISLQLSSKSRLRFFLPYFFSRNSLVASSPLSYSAFIFRMSSGTQQQNM